MTDRYTDSRRQDGDGSHHNGSRFWRAGDQSQRGGMSTTLIRVIFFAVAVALGFVLVETPWSDGLLTMGASYVLANLFIVTLIGATIFFIGQRSRISLAVFVAICLLIGVANFFIIEFKGQPIVPADLFALSTAASVSSGYSLFLTPRLTICLAAFAAYCVALALWCPKRSLTKMSVLINCVIAALLVVLGIVLYSNIDIKKDCNVKVDVWDVRGSYSTQGTLLCFASRAQELTPAKPDGFSPEAVDEILEPYANAAGTGSDTNANTTAQKPASGPNVIAIMNETFSDLSSYPGLEDTNARPDTYYEIAAEALAAGDVYVSAMGGGTCNSEFEFLTGASSGNMGGGVYPYVLYDLDGVNNLASYFDALGYGTHAIHPAEATNWRRDRIYNQLGFQTFDDITTMEDADTLRDLTTDKATYERVLEKIDEAEEPQFVFDVTIQNHGGYDTGLIPAEDLVTLDSDIVQDDEVNEFISCIKRSEEDLRWLIDELQARDEPTVVVFFGDHQPGFVDMLFEKTYGHEVDGSELADVQQRWHTPYFIWANDAALAASAPTRVQQIDNAQTLSLNYLGALTIQAAGLPETAQFAYLNALRTQLPAINMNGYMDADSVWHWYGEKTSSDAQSAAEDALKSYRIVQYDQLFNRQSPYHETE